MGTATEISHPIILFDGTCNLCNGTVSFVAKRDNRDTFRYASLDSEIVQQLKISENELPDSVVLRDENGLHIKSEAVIRIMIHLGRGWQFFKLFRLFPLGLRDRIYDYVARNRYAWFGRAKDCPILPTL